ncbi:hypothetical protein, partial [Photorhabdus heterorhabditis]|uniref:hypothetical protein n=1 Tax=Photorhabdus heterorhabditis TaxID=880156 RepID=UPI000AC85525
WLNNVIVAPRARETSSRKQAGVMIIVQECSLDEDESKYARALRISKVMIGIHLKINSQQKH